MFRVTRQTDYGIVLLTHIATCSRRDSHTARELASETRLPLPMVSKILKLLTKSDVLESQRGAKGGYTLARTPERISVAEVIGALEGPISLTECSSDELGNCEHEDFCQVRGNWVRISQTVRTALEGLTLADMARPESSNLVTLRSFSPATAPPSTV